MKIELNDEQKEALYDAIFLASRALRDEYERLTTANLPFQMRDDIRAMLTKKIDAIGALIDLLSERK